MPVVMDFLNDDPRKKRESEGARHPEKAHRPDNPIARKPDWIRVKAPGSPKWAETHRIVGGGIVGTHAGDMIGEIALAIEMGADAVDIGKTIHPHPTLGESIGMAAEVAHGSCTDLPPAKR